MLVWGVELDLEGIEGSGGGTKRVSSGVLGNAQRIISQTLLLNYYWAWWKCGQFWSWWPTERKVPANESCRRLSLKGSSLRKCVLESINEEEQILTKKNNKAMVGLKRQSWQRYKELNALRGLYQEDQNCHRICHDLYNPLSINKGRRESSHKTVKIEHWNIYFL